MTYKPAKVLSGFSAVSCFGTAGECHKKCRRLRTKVHSRNELMPRYHQLMASMAMYRTGFPGSVRVGNGFTYTGQKTSRAEGPAGGCRAEVSFHWYGTKSWRIKDAVGDDCVVCRTNAGASGRWSVRHPHLGSLDEPNDQVVPEPDPHARDEPSGQIKHHVEFPWVDEALERGQKSIHLHGAAAPWTCWCAATKDHPYSRAHGFVRRGRSAQKQDLPLTMRSKPNIRIAVESVRGAQATPLD